MRRGPPATQPFTGSAGALSGLPGGRPSVTFGRLRPCTKVSVTFEGRPADMRFRSKPVVNQPDVMRGGDLHRLLPARQAYLDRQLWQHDRRKAFASTYFRVSPASGWNRPRRLKGQRRQSATRIACDRLNSVSDPLKVAALLSAASGLNKSH